MVVGFASSEGRHLSDSVVNSHEVGVLRELGDDFTRAHPLSLTCYPGDRHEALFVTSLVLTCTQNVEFQKLELKWSARLSIKVVPLFLSPKFLDLILASSMLLGLITC
jgi:hypothetical protein